MLSFFLICQTDETVRNLTVDLFYPGDVGGDGGARPPAHQDQRPVAVRVLNLSNLHHKIRILSRESPVVSDIVPVIKEDRYYRYKKMVYLYRKQEKSADAA